MPAFIARALRQRIFRPSRIAAAFAALATLNACSSGPTSEHNRYDGGAYPASAPSSLPEQRSASTGRTHQVIKGDTLFSLAKRYNVELSNLKTVNGIGPGAAISVGQILRIPGQTPGASPAPTQRNFALDQEKAQVAASALGPQRIRRPVPGEILRGWGEGVGRRKNAGVDLAARAGDPVHAAANGKVAFVSDPTSPVGAVVLIEHPGGMTTIYGRLTGIAVRPGQQVRAGDIIARIAPRMADRPALHFEIRYGSEPVNPTPFL